MSGAQLAEIEKVEAWLFAIARVASNAASALSRCCATLPKVTVARGAGRS